jgi:hypothetical protein
MHAPALTLLGLGWQGEVQSHAVVPCLLQLILTTVMVDNQTDQTQHAYSTIKTGGYALATKQP